MTFWRYRLWTSMLLCGLLVLPLSSEREIYAIGGGPSRQDNPDQVADESASLTELARSLANTPMVTSIPTPKGNAKYTIDKKHRTFTLKTGETRAVLAKLPRNTTAPYVLTVKSMCNCVGFSKSILAPQGIFLDEEFHPTRRLDGTQFRAVERGGWQLDADIQIGDDRNNDAYLLLYTIGMDVGKRLGSFSDSNGQVSVINWPVSRADHGTIRFETSLPKK